MADTASTSSPAMQNESENKENEDFNFEPTKKKMKTDVPSKEKDHKLEERLSGILCCAVCLDLPRTCFQCMNGHLMCAGCFNHLLADGRLKDETPTCPNCRCEISKTLCSRNLAVEKAVSELPTLCHYCSCQLPRNQLFHHEKELCQDRPSTCKYARIGCPWYGPFHELCEHEISCTHPNKPGREIMDSLATVDKKHQEHLMLYESIFSLLSYEKVTFSDLQLKPYRTDDFITKLFYESSRFSAFNHQWVIKARVEHNQKDPAQSIHRSLSYQLIMKGKITSAFNLRFLALKGPYGDMMVNPAVYSHEFSSECQETPYFDLPVENSVECNKLLASKTINLRLIMVHIQQKYSKKSNSNSVQDDSDDVLHPFFRRFQF